MRDFSAKMGKQNAEIKKNLYEPFEPYESKQNFQGKLSQLTRP